MKNKHWLIPVIIICLLGLAFFWGGDNGKNTINKESPGAAGGIYDTAVSSQPSDAQSDKAYGESVKVPDEHDNTDKSNVEADNAAQTPINKLQSEDTVKIPTKSQSEKTATVSDNKKDKYLTDSVPNSKPKLVERQDTKIDENKKLTCTLSVTCKTILDNMDKLSKDKLEVLPSKGIIYKTQEVTFYEGESVFDVLLREMKNSKIHMEFEMTPIYNSNYIEGIHNIYEFDCGELSGWMYKVNGWFPNYGCSRYKLKDGDVIEWLYTCDLGRDIGGEKAAGGNGQ